MHISVTWYSYLPLPCRNPKSHLYSSPSKRLHNSLQYGYTIISSAISILMNNDFACQ